MERVVIYARVSTEEQNQLNALQKQVDELIAFVKSNKEWVFVGQYIDEGRSGTTSEKRNAYKRLYNDIERDKYDLIVVKDESRLMRSSLDWQLFKDRLIKNDKKLYYFLSNKYYDPKDDLLHDIRVAVAQEYSRDLSKKINNAARYAQEHGTVYGNSLIYGYDKDHGKLVINEEEAEVVRLIFDLYISGMGFRLIQGELTAKGIYSRTGTPFSLTTMKRMIRQEKYKGVVVSHKTTTDFFKKRVTEVPEDERIKYVDGDRCPAIVSAEVWEKANRMLKERCQENGAELAKKRGAFKGNNYPLSGKIVCGKCGKPYWHEHYATKVNKLQRDIWQCSTYKAYGIANGCQNQKLQDNVLKQLLKEVLCELTYNDDVKAVISVIEKNIGEDNSSDVSKLQALRLKQGKLLKRIDNLVINYTDGLINREEYIRVKAQTDTELQKVQRELIEFESTMVVDNTADRLHTIKSFLNRVCENPADIEDSVLKDIVDRIIVDEQNISVYLSCGPAGTFVYDKERQGYACVTASGQMWSQTQIYSTRKKRIRKSGAGSWLYFTVYIF